MSSINLSKFLDESKNDDQHIPAGQLLDGVYSPKEDVELSFEDVFPTMDSELSSQLENVQPVPEYSEAKVEINHQKIVLTSDIEEYVYKMSSKERGCFLIFNQINFDPHLGLNSRERSLKDANELEKVAKEVFKFKYTRVFQDLKIKEIFFWLNQMAKSDHTDYDAFACVFLSHGGTDGTLYARDGTFSLEEVFSLFTADKCLSLAGKPKLFFIQACRGSKVDRGMQVVLSSLTSEESNSIPVESDFLYVYSSVPGYVSWLGIDGSWFFQTLCQCFRMFANQMDILQILTRVNRIVSLNYSTCKGFKQVPCFTSTLTAQLFFN